jgi:hypothetical protein
MEERESKEKEGNAHTTHTKTRVFKIPMAFFLSYFLGGPGRRWEGLGHKQDAYEATRSRKELFLHKPTDTVANFPLSWEEVFSGCLF